MLNPPETTDLDGSFHKIKRNCGGERLRYAPVEGRFLQNPD